MAVADTTIRAGLTRILFATDFSPAGNAALSYAAALVRYLEAELEDPVPKNAGLFRKPQVVVRFGPAVSRIPAFARAQHTDLIVTGEHRPGSVSAHLLGDTAHGVVCSPLGLCSLYAAERNC